MKNSVKIVTGIVLITFSVISCNSSTENEKNEGQKMAFNENKQIHYQIGDHLPNELVCMVNNAYMGEPQLAVPVEGKTYYGCCQMCIGKLNNEESARMAEDPFSGKPVDKATAYIVLAGKEGKVDYFESEENYRKSKKAE